MTTDTVGSEALQILLTTRLACYGIWVTLHLSFFTPVACLASARRGSELAPDIFTVQRWFFGLDPF